jgi:hypothetical protein
VALFSGDGYSFGTFRELGTTSIGGTFVGCVVDVRAATDWGPPFPMNRKRDFPLPAMHPLAVLNGERVQDVEVVAADTKNLSVAIG